MEVLLLCDTAARALLKSPDPARFLDWIAKAGPRLAPSFVQELRGKQHTPEQFFRALGVAIYSATPHPAADYRPLRFTLPYRDGACFCGSGRKFAQCCAELVTHPALPALDLSSHVLDQVSLRELAALPATQISREAVVATAHKWRGELRVERAIALLEPWFDAHRRRWPSTLAPFFDALMDWYLEHGSSRKFDRLLRAALDRGESRLRASALLRRARLQTNAGKRTEAWADFSEAQRLDPAHPEHARTELLLLLALGVMRPDNRQTRALLDVLLERAAALIDIGLAATPVRALPWRRAENQPALRLLAQRLNRLSRKLADDRFATAAEQLLALNPTDEQGVREIPGTAYRRADMVTAISCGETPRPNRGVVVVNGAAYLRSWRLSSLRSCR